jgi:hypothetical protein
VHDYDKDRAKLQNKSDKDTGADILNDKRFAKWILRYVLPLCLYKNRPSWVFFLYIYKL